MVAMSRRGLSMHVYLRLLAEKDEESFAREQAAEQFARYFAAIGPETVRQLFTDARIRRSEREALQPRIKE